MAAPSKPSTKKTPATEGKKTTSSSTGNSVNKVAGSTSSTKNPTSTTPTKKTTTTTKTTTTKTTTSSSSSSSSSKLNATNSTGPTKPKVGAGSKSSTLTKASPSTKKGAPSTSSSSKKKPAVDPKVKSVVLIQSLVRMYLARKAHQERLAAQKERNEMMEKLEKEAWVQMIKYEQEQEQKRMAAEMEKKKKMQEKLKKEKELREAAFDGEVATIKKLLQEGVSIECKDVHGETPLLEASGGGQVECILALVQEGADVNARGKFNRTPLYRAAFGGHTAAVIALLEQGADPSILDHDSVSSAEIAANADSQSAIVNFDPKRTVELSKEAEKRKIDRALKEKAKDAVIIDKHKTELEKAKKAHDAAQLEMHKMYCELEKRILEHDHCRDENMEQRLIDLTLQVVKDAEKEYDRCKLEADRTMANYQQAKLSYRDQIAAVNGGNPELDEFEKYAKCSIREIEDVLMRDVGNRIRDTGRWPLLIDLSKQLSIFLRYRDTNYLNACNRADLSKEKIRMALLGALRFGKPLVIDMMDAHMWNAVSDKFDALQPGLFSALITQKFVKNKMFTSLILESDGEEYKPSHFTDARVANFRLFFLTTLRFPDEAMSGALFPLVVLPQAARNSD